MCEFYLRILESLLTQRGRILTYSMHHQKDKKFYKSNYLHQQKNEIPFIVINFKDKNTNDFLLFNKLLYPYSWLADIYYRKTFLPNLNNLYLYIRNNY